MTDDDRPMDPELLAGIRAIVASNPDGQCATWRALRDVLGDRDQHAKRAHDLANRVQALEFQKLLDDKIREELARLLAAIFPEDRGTHMLDLVGTQLEVSDAIARVEQLRSELTRMADALDVVKAVRDRALRELLAPTVPRYSAANLALDPDETGESD